MKIISASDITHSFVPCVATVGIFDGVHAGHRFLLDELKALAISRNMESVVITFAVHPRKVLYPDFKPKLLTTLAEKLAQLETTGIDTCIVINFAEEMAALSASEFIETILFEKYKVRALLVGHDHRFGHNRTDGFEQYKLYGNALGMEVIQAVRYKTPLDELISSTMIRMALETGNIEQANRLLSYPYSVAGQVIDGFKNGRTIGFPTANLKPNDAEKLIPASGVYAVKVKWNNQTFDGMLNIGFRPTLNNGNSISIETHILNFDQDIYYQQIELIFIQKIRNEQKFNNINELIEQLHKDKDQLLEMMK